MKRLGFACALSLAISTGALALAATPDPVLTFDRPDRAAGGKLWCVDPQPSKGKGPRLHCDPICPTCTEPVCLPGRCAFRCDPIPGCEP